MARTNPSTTGTDLNAKSRTRRHPPHMWGWFFRAFRGYSLVMSVCTRTAQLRFARPLQESGGLPTDVSTDRWRLPISTEMNRHECPFGSGLLGLSLGSGSPETRRGTCSSHRLLISPGLTSGSSEQQIGQEKKMPRARNVRIRMQIKSVQPRKMASAKNAHAGICKGRSFSTRENRQQIRIA